MASRLEKLMFSVALIDKASGPASKLQANMDKLTGRTTAGMAKIGMGAAGLFATGYALKSMLGPAIEMDRAIGEVRSLGVAEGAIKSLERQALAFSIQYGESAVDVARSGFKIQQSIDSLHGDQLGKVTTLAATLAKGTRQSFESVADYTKQMFAVFEQQANRVGNVQFMEQLVGKTATAADLFQVEAQHFGAAMKNVGNLATTSNIPMEEQLAVIGTLTKVMGDGSKAGSGYATFLRGISRAQDVLGLTLTDASGKALPMMDIISKIQGKYGDLSDAASQEVLQKAFGARGLGVITAVAANVDKISGGIEKLKKVTNAVAAQNKAAAIADPWERLSALATGFATVFGRVMQPVLVPLIDKLMAGGQVIMRWTELFPNLTKVVGTGMLVVFGLVAAVSAFSLVSGIASMAMGGLQAIMLIGTGAMWLFNAAMWANPMTWMVAGVVALVAAIVMAIKYWDKIKAAIMDSGPFKMLGAALDWVIDKLNMIPGINIGGGKQSSVPGTGVAPGDSDLVSAGARGGGLNVANKVPVGGLQQSIANNNGTTIEKVEVNTTGGVDGWQLADELALAGG
jgi:TP901 family phage tail tape measure protein